MTIAEILLKAGLPDRIVSKIADDPRTGCWIWTASCNPAGYGQTTWEGRSQRTHRVVYQTLVGPIPEGLQIDHLCRVRHCCNPDHLEPVTNRENARRGVGWAGQNARKAHCVKGHAFDAGNTAVDKHGHRRCVTCGNASQRTYRKARSLYSTPEQRARRRELDRERQRRSRASRAENPVNVTRGVAS